MNVAHSNHTHAFHPSVPTNRSSIRRRTSVCPCAGRRACMLLPLLMLLLDALAAAAGAGLGSARRFWMTAVREGAYRHMHECVYTSTRIIHTQYVPCPSSLTGASRPHSLHVSQKFDTHCRRCAANAQPMRSSSGQTARDASTVSPAAAAAVFTHMQMHARTQQQHDWHL